METALEKAQAQLALANKYGLQARRDLSDREITEVCRAYVEAEAYVAELRKAHAEAERQSEKLRQQRDRANGKLSALQRKYAELERELEAHREVMQDALNADEHSMSPDEV